MEGQQHEKMEIKAGEEERTGKYKRVERQRLIGEKKDMEEERKRGEGEVREREREDEKKRRKKRRSKESMNSGGGQQ